MHQVPSRIELNRAGLAGRKTSGVKVKTLDWQRNSALVTLEGREYMIPDSRMWCMWGAVEVGMLLENRRQR